MGGVGSSNVIRYGDFLNCVFFFVWCDCSVWWAISSRQLRLFAVYSSISDTVNCGRAGRRSAEVHLPSMGVHERGTTLFPRTGAVMLCVSGGSEGDFRRVDASLMEEMVVLEDVFCAVRGKKCSVMRVIAVMSCWLCVSY